MGYDIIAPLILAHAVSSLTLSHVISNQPNMVLKNEKSHIIVLLYIEVLRKSINPIAKLY